MNKLFLIAVAIACSGAVAQEKEIWACQQEDGVMLKRENSAWKQYGVTPGTLLLTVDGLLSERKEGDTITPLTCDKGFLLLVDHLFRIRTYYWILIQVRWVCLSCLGPYPDPQMRLGVL